jgi:hypothetical protein
MGKKNEVTYARVDEYKIEYEEATPSKSRCDAIFADIKKLGKTNIDTYSANVLLQSQEKPWRGAVVRCAETVAAKARRRSLDRENESTWRFDLEHDILARFDVEVTW